MAVPLHVATHLTEMVPLCWALRAAGHEVLVAGAPDVSGTAARAGLGMAEIGPPVDMIGNGRQHLPRDLFPATALGSRDTPDGRFLWEQCALAFAEHADQQAAAHLELVRAWRPDLLLVDSMSLLGWVLGAAAGVPVVQLHCGVTPLLGPFRDKARELLAPVAERIGATGELPAHELLLDPCLPELQAPDSPPGRAVRYVPFNGSGVRPDRAGGPPAGRRRICVTFGSVLAWTGPAAVRTVLEALAPLEKDGEAEIVLALSRANLAETGELPESVRVLEQCPLDLFLPGCDLIVHHGGTGTGLTAAALGVPQLALPQWGNAFDFGRRLAESGAGLTAETREQQQDADGLRTAVRRLLDEPAFPAAAARLRDSNALRPSPAALVPALEEAARRD